MKDWYCCNMGRCAMATLKKPGPASTNAFEEEVQMRTAITDPESQAYCSCTFNRVQRNLVSSREFNILFNIPTLSLPLSTL